MDSDDSYDFHETNCQTLAALRIPGLPQPVSPLIMLLGGKKTILYVAQMLMLYEFGVSSAKQHCVVPDAGDDPVLAERNGSIS